MRQLYQQRLRVLERQEAQYGSQTPPHTLTEIEDLKHKIADITVQLNPVTKAAQITGQVSTSIEEVTIAFDVPTAQRFATNGNIATWVHVFLTLGPRQNFALSKGLQLQQRWWLGPLEVPIDCLTPSEGSEPEMEYRYSYVSWEQKIRAAAAALTDIRAVPPLIVEYRTDSLSIRNGNLEYEAMRRKGWTTAWVIIWYNSEADYERDARRWLNSEPA
jgi:hypothetical protein